MICNILYINNQRQGSSFPDCPEGFALLPCSPPITVFSAVEIFLKASCPRSHSLLLRKWGCLRTKTSSLETREWAKGEIFSPWVFSQSHTIQTITLDFQALIGVVCCSFREEFAGFWLKGKYVCMCTRVPHSCIFLYSLFYLGQGYGEIAGIGKEEDGGVHCI